MKKLFFALLIVVGGCGEETFDLANEAPNARECDSTHPLVGQSRDLSTSIYISSGTVTVLSDCEIEISNFTYDGRGPAVTVYGASNGNFSAGVNLSEELNGTPTNNASFSVFLPEDSTLDELNSFSIWCYEFGIDFGSASFAN